SLLWGSLGALSPAPAAFVTAVVRCNGSLPSRDRGHVNALPVAAGLFETHLTVSDLARSVAFYRDVVGLPVALELPERGAAFLWIGGPGEAMLGLWSLGSAPMA